MSLEHVGFVELPPHVNDGGFDHAAVHEASGRIYVAHTANDAIDVIDIDAQKYVGSVPGLTAVAGALVSESSSLVFTSNRGENTVGIFAPDDVPRVGREQKPGDFREGAGQEHLHLGQEEEPQGAA